MRIRSAASSAALSCAVAFSLACSSSTPSVRGADASPEDTGDEAATDVAPSHCSGPMPGLADNEPFQRQRTTEDQPDDAPDQAQIHVLYVEPSDRTASPQLDTDGSLRRSVNAFEAWFASRMGGSKPRFDTCEGVLDVTYVKLAAPYTQLALATGTSLTGAVINPVGPDYTRDRLVKALKKQFADPRKLYLVYYDGLGFGRCGGAAYPPSIADHFTQLTVGGLFESSLLWGDAAAGATTITLFDTSQLPLPMAPFDAKLGDETVHVASISGNAATLSAPLAKAHAKPEILHAVTKTPDCRANPFSSDGQQLDYWEYAAAHESMHPLGIVPDDAPDFAMPPVAPGHLSATNPGAGTADLMYEGSEPWTCPTTPPAPNASASPCKLDPLHRNYFQRTADGTHVDLARSAFLDPTPDGAQLPPKW